VRLSGGCSVNAVLATSPHPLDSQFFEWRAIKGARAKQPYAVTMKDRTPFAIAGLWENWRHPRSGEWIRTFAILTVPANDLVGQIHDRMPLILPKSAYERRLGQEPDPYDLLTPFPSDLMMNGQSRRGLIVRTTTIPHSLIRQRETMGPASLAIECKSRRSLVRTEVS
jgi:putative SOS response-associated peptidase YedK